MPRSGIAKSYGSSVWGNLFIFFLAALGPCCFSWTFSSCSDVGLVSVVVPSFSLRWSSCCRAQALGTQISVVAAPGSEVAEQAHFWVTGTRARAQPVVAAHKLSCSEACGIFPDQGIEHVSPALAGDSYLLCHKGSPVVLFL